MLHLQQTKLFCFLDSGDVCIHSMMEGFWSQVDTLSELTKKKKSHIWLLTPVISMTRGVVVSQWDWREGENSQHPGQLPKFLLRQVVCWECDSVCVLQPVSTFSTPGFSSTTSSFTANTSPADGESTARAQKLPSGNCCLYAYGVGNKLLNAGSHQPHCSSSLFPSRKALRWRAEQTQTSLQASCCLV